MAAVFPAPAAASVVVVVTVDGVTIVVVEGRSVVVVEDVVVEAGRRFRVVVVTRLVVVVVDARVEVVVTPMVVVVVPGSVVEVTGTNVVVVVLGALVLVVLDGGPGMAVIVADGGTTAGLPDRVGGGNSSGRKGATFPFPLPRRPGARKAFRQEAAPFPLPVRRPGSPSGRKPVGSIIPSGRRSGFLPETYRKPPWCRPAVFRVRFPAMPSSSDTYSAAQAAEIIGVSERRIRQLVAEGKLPGRRSRDGTVRIPQQAVNEERRKRRSGPSAAGRVRKQAGGTAAASSRKPAPVDVDALASAVASAVGQRIEGQLEVTRRAESLIRAELDEERARRAQAEARLEEAERKLAEAERRAAEAEARRGLFRRRATGAS